MVGNIVQGKAGWVIWYFGQGLDRRIEMPKQAQWISEALVFFGFVMTGNMKHKLLCCGTGHGQVLSSWKFS
jgi:hypothetical protein